VKKILAVASGGGHWIQMMQLKKVFDGHDVSFVSVKEFYRQDVLPYRFYSVMDVSRLNKWLIIFLIGKLIYIFIKEKPEVIITTGSAPGMLALRIGKMFGARTIWIDSIANVDEISFSGRKAIKFADLCLTQWPHLADADGPFYLGSVL
jgi:UDP-N-acetylglucosamine:LPS N-acetylglucosamine transferase